SDDSASDDSASDDSASDDSASDDSASDDSASDDSASDDSAGDTPADDGPRRPNAATATIRPVPSWMSDAVAVPIPRPERTVRPSTTPSAAAVHGRTKWTVIDRGSG